MKPLRGMNPPMGANAKLTGMVKPSSPSYARAGRMKNKKGVYSGDVSRRRGIVKHSA